MFLSTRFLLTALVVVGSISLGESKPVSVFSSSSGEFSIKLIDASPPGTRTLIIVREDSAISEYSTQGSLVDVLWSEKCRFAAVNNLRHGGGDLLWVFNLANGKALKEPENDDIKTACAKVTAAFPGYVYGNLAKHFSFAYGWKSVDKLAVLNILFFDRDLEGAFAVYDTYLVKENSVRLLEGSLVKRVPSAKFDEFPSIAASFWTGWQSPAWRVPGTRPAWKPSF